MSSVPDELYTASPRCLTQSVASLHVKVKVVLAGNVTAALAEPPSIVSDEAGYNLQSVVVMLATTICNPAAAVGKITPSPEPPTVPTTLIVSVNAVASP